MRLTAENSMLRVERGNLPDGIYMLRMSSNGQIQTRKVIFR
ncbi:MAG: T9SS type A sorting domain-containing protein [Bacteroidales bacterium]|nr:T9SS type A sorting domain-containing protein [Bacteroidales bacterium]